MDASLGMLHGVIQVAFDWENSHLHDFLIGKIRFGMLDDEGESDLLVVDEEGAPLAAVATVGSQLLYTYDSGDDWEHDVVVERVVDDGGQGITCSGGARGGVGRGFDPERFNLTAVNKRLAALTRRLLA